MDEEERRALNRTLWQSILGTTLLLVVLILATVISAHFFGWNVAFWVVLVVGLVAIFLIILAPYWIRKRRLKREEAQHFADFQKRYRKPAKLQPDSDVATDDDIKRAMKRAQKKHRRND